jgi:hypothetical protein
MKYRIKCITYENKRQLWVVEVKASFITGWAVIDTFITFEEAESVIKNRTVVSETIINFKK